MIRRIPIRLCRYHFSHRALIQTSHIHLGRKVIAPQNPELKPPINTSNETAAAHTIKDKIWGFIRRETMALKNSLEDDHLESELEAATVHRMVSDLDPLIQKELEKQTDDYNRLQTLLTFHPILVRPAMYYRFRDALQAPLSGLIKTLYIQRLVYHQQFKECWEILLEDANESTLTDLEEYLNVIVSELESNNNIEFGLRSFGLRGFQNIQSPSFLATAIDYICYKNNILRVELQLNYNYYLELQAIDSIRDLEKHIVDHKSRSIFEDLLQFERRFQITTELSAIRLLFHKCSVRFKKNPGWISYILSGQSMHPLPIKSVLDFTVNPYYASYNLAKLVPSMKGLRPNDYDYLHVLQNTTASDAFNVFLSYHRSTQNSKRNKYIVNHLAKLVLQNGKPEQISRVCMDACECLEGKALSDGLVAIWNSGNTVQFQKVVKRVHKKRDSNMLFFVYRRLQVQSIDECDFILKTFYRTSVSNKVAANLISQVHLLGDESARYLFYNRVLLEFNFSSFTLLELFRSYVVRENGREPEFLGQLFETILAKSLSKDIILPRVVRIDDLVSDFQSLWKHSRKAEKARFHNRIRAVAQAISQLSAEDIAQVCNILQSRIYSDDFKFCEAKHGKKYVTHCLIFDLMRFFDRRKEGMKALADIKKVNKSLSYSSPICQGYMYKIIARENPLGAIKSFTESHFDKRKPLPRSLLRFIANGLLESPSLSNKQKLLYFEEFKRSVESLGQKFPLSPLLTTQIAKLILQILKEEDIGSFVDTKKEIGNIAKSYGIPYRVQRGLIKSQ